MMFSGKDATDRPKTATGSCESRKSGATCQERATVVTDVRGVRGRENGQGEGRCEFGQTAVLKAEKIVLPLAL
jgi:hypothetical protein